MMPLVVARTRRFPVALCAAGLGLFLSLVYLPVVRDLIATWWDVSYYAYGFLIPIFSGYVIWDSRERLTGPPVGRLEGLMVVILALTLLAAGASMDSLTVRGLSLPFALAGLAFFVLGPNRFRIVAGPVAFLVLMIPLPQGTLPALSGQLQILAASVTTTVLNAIGIAAVRDGILIHLDRVNLEVSEACNGLRFLLAMVVTGTAFAWLTQRGALRRAVVLVVAIVVGVVANLLRVAGTGIIAHAYGPEAASGLLHLAYGKAVYGVMLIPFVMVVLVLKHRGERSLTD